MAVKVTFTLDEGTVTRLARLAARTRQAKSAVVREALAEYDERGGRLNAEEIRERLAIYDRFLAQPSSITRADVDREQEELRKARRSEGRLHPLA